eukprot:TRINITY_DN24612_c0_g1_i1.p1 TRINITY_DN24612_c0_g1~~TRINITY_DN24612_c0_g1_i1.p1  ORF type:complete len:480 (+),score=56.64 TRINITY_DN24612_c0_g1_i1:40-1479(+)
MPSPLRWRGAVLFSSLLRASFASSTTECETKCSSSDVADALEFFSRTDSPAYSFYSLCVKPRALSGASNFKDGVSHCSCFPAITDAFAGVDQLVDNFTHFMKVDLDSVIHASRHLLECTQSCRKTSADSKQQFFQLILSPLLDILHEQRFNFFMTVAEPWRSEEVRFETTIFHIWEGTRKYFRRGVRFMSLSDDCAVNLFAGTCSARHASVFHRFPPIIGPTPRRHSLDFLGIATDETFSCRVSMGEWASFNPNRKFECWGHETGSWRQRWPIVDEEYFEWADVLEAAASAADRGSGFAVAEVGSGTHAIWGIRAAVAFNRLAQPEATCDVLSVEAFRPDPERLRQHVAANLPEDRCNIISSDTKIGGTETLASILDGARARVRLWDLVDMDIQGSELQVVRSELHLLRARARALHISTHSRAMHFEILGRLRAAGWTIRFDFAPRSIASLGRFGPLVSDDGHISALSPDATHVNLMPT